MKLVKVAVVTPIKSKIFSNLGTVVAMKSAKTISEVYNKQRFQFKPNQ
jgi:hypothetical protein